MFDNPLAQIALIAFLSIISQWMGWRFRIPSIVFLLLSGFAFGSLLGIVEPSILMGNAVQPIVSVAVAIILFEGSLNLDFKEIKQGRRTVRQIVFIGGAIAWLLTAIAAHYLGGLSWPVAVPFGALLIVTGPTVIMPLLRHAKLNTRVSSILKWEGIVNDPVGAVLAILAYEYFKISAETGKPLTEFTLETGVMILGIILLSICAGIVIAMILNRGWVPEFLKSTFLFCCVICFFVCCNALLHESGLIAVTVLGIVLANRNVSSIEDLRRVKETVTIMLISGVFIVLTSTIKPDVLLNLDWRGILFILSLLFVVRPISIFIASIGTDLSFKEKALISYIAPRGVVCAAVAGILGPLLVEAGYPDGEKLLPLAFAIVVTTVFLHGLTVKKLGRKLELAFPSRGGLIVVGAYNWTIQFCEVLKDRGIEIMVADTNWQNLKNARLANIPIYYGEILSEDSDYTLEINRYNTILAATGNPAYNALVCNKFAHDFGRERVFQLSPGDEEVHERKKITEKMRGRILAYQGLNTWDFEQMYHQGWRFKTTRVNANFNLDTLKESKEKGKSLLIGVITNTGQLQFSPAESPANIKDDTTVILFSHE